MNTFQQFTFKDGRLARTNYYQSADFARGQAWLAVHDRVWHVLLPHPPRSRHIIQAGPMEAPEEPGGWQWQLNAGGELFPLPSDRVHIASGPTPSLPDPGQYFDRRCIIYHGYTVSAGYAAFGGCHELTTGLQSNPHRLWLTNGIRVDYRERCRPS